MSPRWRPAVIAGRKVLDRVAQTSPKMADVMAVAGTELSEASNRAWQRRILHPQFYGAGYFGSGRDPDGDREGLSGYATYDRLSSNADVAGTVLWRQFGGVRSVLDIGCATGHLVEVLREKGLEATGVDLSEYAIARAAPGAAGHIQTGDLLAGLPFADGAFDLVAALEIFEHMPPGSVPAAIAETRRVCKGFCYATIPSFGSNGGGGPDGYFEGKVRPERLGHYEELGSGYRGPLPFADLARDGNGDPVEGHLSIASFTWWEERFVEGGFERRPDLEKRVYDDLVPELTNTWDVYVFSVPGLDSELSEPRSPEKTLVDLGLHHPLYGT